MGTSKTKEGKQSGAHVDPVEVDGELGEGRTAMNLTAVIRGTDEEDDGAVKRKGQDVSPFVDEGLPRLETLAKVRVRACARA